MTDMERDLRDAVEARLAARLEENRVRRDGRRRRLQEMSERRRYGLAARHRNKATRTQEKPQ
ncbi:hypothetical protein [Spirillospora sp. CA-128828]|uniref:hypothetical protein n=1 Tax=Spirillospora sp. CA-128828 TaxID=3240033 RepID=UPI003D948419